MSTLGVTLNNIRREIFGRRIGTFLPGDEVELAREGYNETEHPEATGPHFKHWMLETYGKDARQRGTIISNEGPTGVKHETVYKIDVGNGDYCLVRDKGLRLVEY